MQNVRKSDGTIVIKGVDGRIIGNIGAGALAGPASASPTVSPLVSHSPISVPDNIAPGVREIWPLLGNLNSHIPGIKWALIGGHMVLAHALSNGVHEEARATEDADTLVELGMKRRDTEKVAKYLERNGYTLEGISAMGIGHRFTKQGEFLQLKIDILAPEGHRDGTFRGTSGNARTVVVQGGRRALALREPMAFVFSDGLSVDLPVPSLLGALVIKSAAIDDPAITKKHKHTEDVLFLASLINDPFELRGLLEKKDRKRLTIGLNRARATIKNPSPRQSLGLQSLEVLLGGQ